MTPADIAWTTPELVAAIAAILAAIGGLLRASRRVRVRTGGLAALVAGWLGLAGAVAPASLHERWPLLVVALFAAALAGWGIARLLAGREAWLLAIGGAVIVLRVPVPTGDGTSMLLAPLYAVVFLGMFMLLRTELVAARAAQAPLLPDRGHATRLLDLGIALYPALATLSLLWSIDREGSIEQLAFFLVPFQLVYALVRAWVRDVDDLRRPTLAFVGFGVAAAMVGLFQAATTTVWWNPKVIDANRFRADFRTNSIFYDPNIYGRALVLAALAVVAWLLVTRLDRRRAMAAIGVLGILAVALWHAYSQSSWLALAVSLGIIAVLTLPPRARRWAGGLILVALLVGVPLGARALGGDDLEGRVDVVRDGIELASDRPFAGWGVGAFQTAALRQARGEQRETIGLTASHTTPVTVVAELGVLGAASYALLLASALVVALARWRRASTPASAARARGMTDAGPGWPIAPVIFATGAVAALVAHSLLYAGFFEDATLWAALAVLASLPRVTGDAPD